MSKEYQIDELRWVRLFSPVSVPKYLIDQIKHKDYTTEDFFKYQEINCLISGKEGHVLNPLNHLYALVDPENLVKGVLWFIIDPLSKEMIINTFSVDKEYWGNGKAIDRLANHVKEIKKKLKIEKVYWLTRYPKHSERHGFKRSKSVLMEYTGEENGKDITRKHAEQGEPRPVESGATAAI